jgi:hypothetical protein
MVTVNADPTLSRQYNETVCVAGVLVPFRDMEQSKQFQKCDIIEIDVTVHSRDDRAP